MSTTSARRQQIVRSLQEKAYRDAFVAEHITTGLPFQIRATREAHGWTQTELGHRAGMAQETISLLESPDYGRFTLRTLKRLASAFDIALVVRFVPFSQLVDWVNSLSPEDLAVPSFAEDLHLAPADGALTASTASLMPPELRAISVATARETFDNSVPFSGITRAITLDGLQYSVANTTESLERVSYG